MLLLLLVLAITAAVAVVVVMVMVVVVSPTADFFPEVAVGAVATTSAAVCAFANSVGYTVKVRVDVA